jgi:NTE family protein
MNLKAKANSLVSISKVKMLLCNHFLLFLTIAYCLFSSDLYAQDKAKKPKIGLVLSGGGAKGLAHIGVLKEIERAGIKIDYIGGTSMGAIIGGLYACGYSANELDSIFSSADADAILQDNIPRGNKTFYEKYNDEVYALTLPFQNLKISFPKGFSKGLYNYNLLSRLTHKYRSVTDFNQLKIPFLCIATDVETGEEIVLRKGNLPLSLTASGAFPSLYSPVEIDNRNLIDGGVTNNFPIEEVKKMGADIIIGVDVQDDLKDINTISGGTGVLAQISNFRTVEAMSRKKKLADIYIKPDIKGFSVISFDQGKDIIQSGVDACIEFKKDFAELSTGYVLEKNNLKEESLSIKGIQIEGYKNYTRQYFLGKLRVFPGKKITYTDLQSGLNNLNATQNFSSINYRLIGNEGGDDLFLKVVENPVKTFLKLGLHYDGLFKSSALLNVTKKNLLFKNDLASVDFILGDFTRYNLDYYIDNGFKWSFGLKSNFDQFSSESATDFKGGQFLSTLNRKSINMDYLVVSNRAYLQTLFIQKFSMGGGLEHKFVDITSDATSSLDYYIDRSNYFSAFGFLRFDSFDNKFFPKKGWYFYGDFNSQFYSTDYANDFQKISMFMADMAYVKTYWNRLSVKLQTEGGFTIGENQNHINDFVLGGYGFHRFGFFRHFFGYDFLSLSGDSYVKGSLTADYIFYRKHHFNFTANYSNIGQKIFDDQEWITNPNYSGYSLGYGLETLIGPVEIKHTWSPETRKHYTWFSVGFWF